MAFPLDFLLLKHSEMPRGFFAILSEDAVAAVRVVHLACGFHAVDDLRQANEIFAHFFSKAY